VKAFFMVLLLCAPVLFAQDSQIAIPANINVSADIGPNVDAILRDLASKMGLTIEELRPYYVAQATVESGTYKTVYRIMIITLLVLLVLAVVTLFLGDGDAVGPAWGAFLIVFAICAIVFLASFGDYRMATYNPELWAVKSMVRDATGLVK
jgi:hypothetical protein